MHPRHEEIQFTLRCLFVLFLLVCTFYAEVLRRATNNAVSRTDDGTDWGHLCLRLIFPQIFWGSTLLMAMVVGAFHLTNFFFYSSSSGEALERILTVSLTTGGVAAAVGAFLAYCLAGSTPQKVLPRVYAVLLLPFSCVTYGFLEMTWL